MKVVLGNCPEYLAQTMASTLVTEQLAACVTLLPGAVSWYRWKGELCKDAHSMLLIKASDHQLPALHKRYSALHPDDVPEFVTLAVDEALSDPRYVEWVAGQRSS